MSNSIPRRDFLVQSSVVTAGVVGLAMTPQLAADVRDREHVKFKELVGQEFAVSRKTEQHGTEQGVAVLCEVKDHRSPSDKQRPGHLRQSAFSLLFQVAQGEDLHDGIYRIEHPALGGADMFLHPTVRHEDPTSQHLVAVFN